MEPPFGGWLELRGAPDAGWRSCRPVPPPQLPQLPGGLASAAPCLPVGTPAPALGRSSLKPLHSFLSMSQSTQRARRRCQALPGKQALPRPGPACWLASPPRVPSPLSCVSKRAAQQRSRSCISAKPPCPPVALIAHLSLPHIARVFAPTFDARCTDQQRPAQHPRTKCHSSSLMPSLS